MAGGVALKVDRGRSMRETSRKRTEGHEITIWEKLLCLFYKVLKPRLWNLNLRRSCVKTAWSSCASGSVTRAPEDGSCELAGCGRKSIPSLPPTFCAPGARSQQPALPDHIVRLIPALLLHTVCSSQAQWPAVHSWFTHVVLLP